MPDDNDRHVLAAAIKAGASSNVRDFPSEILSEYDIEAQHPDDFILYQKEENLSLVIEKLRKCRTEHQSPQLSVEEFIQRLRTSDLPLTASNYL